MKKTRREVLSAIGLAAGASALSGFAGEARPQTGTKDPAKDWQYVPLDAAAVAAEAYRLMPEGGCMYAVFRAVVTAWFNQVGRSADSFPFHMMRYGHGGVGGWGTVCGALNGGAAIVGLFEPDKAREDQLIEELFSWYERSELPVYRCADIEPASIAKSVATSILCHVSAARWCKVSGAEPQSKERKQRCSCLTADVAAKTVELLNRHLASPLPLEPTKAGLKLAAEPPRAIGKMQCTTCHQQ